MTLAPAEDGVSCIEAPYGSDLYAEALRLRDAVLRAPLGLAFTDEELADDVQRRHFVATANGAVVGSVSFKALGPHTLQLKQMAVALPDGEYKHPFLEAFGRPARAMACECERDTETNLGQALQLVGGRTVQDKIASPAGRVARLLSAGRSDVEVLEELFLATLSRQPSGSEREALLQRFARAGKAGRQTAAEDLLHALLNHREFLFQH